MSEVPLYPQTGLQTWFLMNGSKGFWPHFLSGGEFIDYTTSMVTDEGPLHLRSTKQRTQNVVLNNPQVDNP